ncbi:MAG: toxin-antitoxin system YwqK family antitoxin [Planctomycetes bacterium]|nr:toxin-antitoxin system YwqK family antitoxin [Planctomycetota bacterium]
MANITEITCPHCQGKQRIVEERLTGTVVCMLCNQQIVDAYLYKVAPKHMELAVALKGKLVTDFGTTILENVEAKSDAYTGRKPTDKQGPKSQDLQALDRFAAPVTSSGYVPTNRKLSSAARTYVIGGVVILVVLAGVGVGLWQYVASQTNSASLRTVGGGDGKHIDRYPSGLTRAEWMTIKTPDGEVMHGAWAEWYETGAKKEIGTYDTGVKTGEWTGFHESGAVRYKGIYEKDEKHGRWLEYHPDGSKAGEGMWNHGQNDGEWREWHPNGKLKKVEYYEQGVPRGVWATWHPNSERQSTGEYKNGRKHGRWVTYTESGIEDFSQTWADGRLEGPTHGCHPNTQRSFEGQWAAGLQAGTWRWWHENGQLKREGQYLEGKEAGEWQEWHPGGGLKAKGRYDAGNQTGEWTELDERGDLVTTRTYTDGQVTGESLAFKGRPVERRQANWPDGTRSQEGTVLVVDGRDVQHGWWRGWHENGQLAEEGLWLDGRKEGLWVAFDSNGIQYSKLTYKNGAEVQPE